MVNTYTSASSYLNGVLTFLSTKSGGKKKLKFFSNVNLSQRDKFVICDSMIQRKKKRKKKLYDDVVHYATSYWFGISYIHVIIF